MPLIVEDGSGLATAEAYASVADADVYFSARGYTLWATMSTAEKEQALRRASDYMLQAYRQRWSGARADVAQALDWPREYVIVRDAQIGVPGHVSYYPSDAVPPLVVQANCLLAFKAASGELSADLGVPVVEEQVGPIRVRYQEGARQSVRYKAIDDMLAAFLAGSESSVRLVRA